MSSCTRCKTENPVGAVHCERCGSSLPLPSKVHVSWTMATRDAGQPGAAPRVSSDDKQGSTTILKQRMETRQPKPPVPSLRTHPDVPTKRLPSEQGQGWRSAVLGTILGIFSSWLIYRSAGHDSMLGRVFNPDRLESVIPVTISAFFFWALVTCFQRWRRLRALARTSNPELLSRAIEVLRSARGLEGLAEDLDMPAFQSSPLLRRLHGVVQQWRIKPGVWAADIVLQQYVTSDNEGIHAGYSLVRLFVWALPVLGLIGTVLGISAAVGGFANFLGGDIDDVSTIKTNLVGVTGGLSFAFLITLHGLLTSLVIMLAASYLQTREEKIYSNAQQCVADSFLLVLQELAPEANETNDRANLEIWRQRLRETAEGLLSTVRDLAAEVLNTMARREQ